MEQVNTRPLPAWDKDTHEARDWVRVVGNVTDAHIETADPSLHRQDNSDFEPHSVAGSVSVDAKTGITRIESPHISEKTARSLEFDYRRALLDSRLIEPEQSTRYRIGGDYVALDRISAERLANIRGVSVKVESGVEIVHSTDRWAFWSDGIVTTAIGLPKWACAVKTLSTDAERIYSLYRSSDSCELYVGRDGVFSVATIVSEETVSVEIGGSAIYAPPRVKKMRVKLTNGSEADWWLHTEGYPEGYSYDLFPSLEELQAALKPKPPLPQAYVPMTGQLWEACPRCGREPVYMPLHLCEKCWPEKDV